VCNKKGVKKMNVFSLSVDDYLMFEEMARQKLSKKRGRHRLLDLSL